TQEHVPTGTPAFMSPETVLGETIDGQSDLYSLGCTLYWLLTGELVYDEDTPLKMMMAHVHQTPLPPSQRTELHITPEVDALVMRCLERDRSARFRDAQQLLEAVEEVAGRMSHPWTQKDAQAWWARRPVQSTRAAC
ncbi:MAG: protein kinase, partial [Myxococcota bacterium]